MINQGNLYIPKALIAWEKYKDLGYREKLLYSFMLERALEKGMENPIIYKVEEVEEVLRCSKPTAISALKELEKYELIEKLEKENFEENMFLVKNISL